MSTSQRPALNRFLSGTTLVESTTSTTTSASASISTSSSSWTWITLSNQGSYSLASYRSSTDSSSSSSSSSTSTPTNTDEDCTASTPTDAGSNSSGNAGFVPVTATTATATTLTPERLAGLEVESGRVDAASPVEQWLDTVGEIVGFGLEAAGDAGSFRRRRRGLPPVHGLWNRGFDAPGWNGNRNPWREHEDRLFEEEFRKVEREEEERRAFERAFEEVERELAEDGEGRMREQEERRASHRDQNVDWESATLVDDREHGYQGGIEASEPGSLRGRIRSRL